MPRRPAGRLAAAVAATAVLATTVSLPAAGGPDELTRTDPDAPFTLVVIPDTQLAVQNRPEMFTAQTEWIVEHRRELNIPFVAHVGDLVEWPSRVSDWERAQSAMFELNRRVPYSFSVGNHDFDAWACDPPATCNPNEHIAVDRSTEMLNAYFPEQMFRRLPGFGGSYPAGSMDNSWFQFSAGGVGWLVLNLKYNPTDDELAWANEVVAAHPDRQVIVNAHEYLRRDDRSAIGERIWTEFARRHANVQFVLSGHYTYAGRQVAQGDHGNTVYAFLADYQTYSIPNVTENSYLRTMRFDPVAGTIDVRTYSPYCEQTGLCPAYKTDARNQFTVTGVEFDRS